MFSKDLSILFIFIAGQSNFETALATCCAVLSNLNFVTAALVLKSLPTPGLETWGHHKTDTFLETKGHHKQTLS